MANGNTVKDNQTITIVSYCLACLLFQNQCRFCWISTTAEPLKMTVEQVVLHWFYAIILLLLPVLLLLTVAKQLW